MKKVILTAICVFGLTSISNAQVGTTQINVGLGFDSWDGIPVYLGADYYVTDDISVGGEISYASLNDYNGYKDDISVFGIAATGNYHFDNVLQLPDVWNVYGGLNLSYYNWSYDGSIKDPNDGLNLGAQVGARYFFTPNWAANLQFGGGSNVSGGKIGVTYRLQ